MKKFFTLIMAVAALSLVSRAADPVSMTFDRTGTAPEIDGMIGDNDPWSEDKWVELQFPKMNDANTTSDMSAKMQMLFSKDLSETGGYIYLIVNVQDATPNNDATAISNSYERDCAEIFFAMDTAAAAVGGKYQDGTWQIRCQREAADEASYIEDGKSGVLTAAEDFKWAVETDAYEFTEEFMFPVATLINGGTFDGKNFRFDLQAADNTTGAAGGRTQQMYWNSAASDNQWQDSRDFGLVVVSDVVVSAPNVKTLAGKAFVSNNMLNISNVNGAVAIYDLKGTMMSQATINGKGSINIASLQSGVYIVKGKDIATKFVK